MLLACANNTTNQFSTAAARAMGFKLVTATNVGSGGLAVCGFISHPGLQRFRPNNDETTVGKWTGNQSSSMDRQAPMPVKSTIEWHVAAQATNQATWYGTEFDQDTSEIDAFFASCADLTTTVDVTPAFFPGVAAEPVESFASQDLNDGFQQETDDPWWSNVYGFPDYPPEFLAPPEATVEQIQAAHPTGGEHDLSTLVPLETSDYQSGVSEVETPTEWPPPPSDAELLAAQPSFDAQDPSAFVPIETEDYATSSPLDVSTEWPPPPSDAEGQAAQPSFADDLASYVPEETQDYDPSVSLDLTSALFPPAVVEPIETFAAQPHFGDDLDSYVAEETEDYASDATLDLSALGARTVYPTPLDSGYDPTNLASYATDVVAPEANRWVVLDAFVRYAVLDFETIVPSGLGLTWLFEVGDRHTSDDGWGGRFYAWTGPTAPTPGAITLDVAGGSGTAVGCAWVVSQLENADPADPFLGASSVVAGAGTDTQISGTATYDPANPGDRPLISAHHKAQESSTPHAGYVEIADVSGANPALGVASAYDPYTQEPTPSFSWSSNVGGRLLLVSVMRFFDPPTDAEAQAEASPYGGEAFWPDPETEDYDPSVSVDVASFLGIPAAAEPIETFAAQPAYGEWFFDEQPTEDYADALSADVAAIFSTPVEPVETLLAGPFFVENDPVTHVAEEPVDYQPYVSELETPTEWRPPPTDAELLAAQPTFDEHDFATLVPAETEDYANDSALEIPTLFPTPPTDAELLAAQPSYGELPIPAEETEDHANDSAVDVAPFLGIPVGQEPIETFAAQPHLGELPIEPEETADYAAESTLGIPAAIVPAPPTDAELLAAQAAEQPFFDPAEETTDYDPSVVVDVSGAFAPTPDETIAAQPFFGDLPIEPEETTDYDGQPSIDVAPFVALPVQDAELLGAQPHFGDQLESYVAEETTDYQADATLDVAATFFPPAGAEVFGAQPHYGEWFWEAEETDDYVGDAPLDVVASLFPPAAIVAETIGIVGVPDDGVAVAGATEAGAGLSGVPEAGTDLSGVPGAGIGIIGVPDSGASAE